MKVRLFFLLSISACVSCATNSFFPSGVYYSKNCLPEMGCTYHHLLLDKNDSTYSLIGAPERHGSRTIYELGNWTIRNDTLILHPNIELSRQNNDWSIIDCTNRENLTFFNVEKLFRIKGKKIIDITNYQQINDDLFGLPSFGVDFSSFGNDYILLD